jgi:chemotaxis protein CheX
MVGLSGKAAGTVVVSFSRELALKVASAMHVSEMTDINAEVIDAIGELTNIVAGAAKAELAQYKLSMSLPAVVTGHHHEIRFPSDVTPVCVPFQTDWGPLTLEVGLVAKRGAVAV